MACGLRARHSGIVVAAHTRTVLIIHKHTASHKTLCLRLLPAARCCCCVYSRTCVCVSVWQIVLDLCVHHHPHTTHPTLVHTEDVSTAERRRRRRRRRRSMHAAPPASDRRQPVHLYKFVSKPLRSGVRNGFASIYSYTRSTYGRVPSR